MIPDFSFSPFLYQQGEEGMKGMIVTQHEDLAKSEKRFEVLKAHAQKKMDECVSSFLFSLFFLAPFLSLTFFVFS